MDKYVENTKFAMVLRIFFNFKMKWIFNSTFSQQNLHYTAGGSIYLGITFPKANLLNSKVLIIL